jgi:hypothetical protein
MSIYTRYTRIFALLSCLTIHTPHLICCCTSSETLPELPSRIVQPPQSLAIAFKHGDTTFKVPPMVFSLSSHVQNLYELSGAQDKYLYNKIGSWIYSAYNQSFSREAWDQERTDIINSFGQHAQNIDILLPTAPEAVWTQEDVHTFVKSIKNTIQQRIAETSLAKNSVLEVNLERFDAAIVTKVAQFFQQIANLPQNDDQEESIKQQAKIFASLFNQENLSQTQLFSAFLQALNLVDYLGCTGPDAVIAESIAQILIKKTRAEEYPFDDILEILQHTTLPEHLQKLISKRTMRYLLPHIASWLRSIPLACHKQDTNSQNSYSFHDDGTYNCKWQCKLNQSGNEDSLITYGKNILAAVYNSDRLRLWHRDEENPYLTIAHKEMPNVKFIDFGSDDSMLATTHDHTVCIWNTMTGEILRTLEFPEKTIAAAKFFNNDTRLVVASEEIMSVFNTKTNQLLYDFSADRFIAPINSYNQTFLTHCDQERIIHNANNGKRLASIPHDGAADICRWGGSKLLTANLDYTKLKIYNTHTQTCIIYAPLPPKANYVYVTENVLICADGDMTLLELLSILTAFKQNNYEYFKQIVENLHCLLPAKPALPPVRPGEVETLTTVAMPDTDRITTPRAASAEIQNPTYGFTMRPQDK